MRIHAVLLGMMVGLFAVPALAQQKAATMPAKLRTYTTPYYLLQTDVDEDGAREAYIRMTKMFEEYQRRTRGFSGEINGRFPFFLYTKADDYRAAGGPKESAGAFIIDDRGARLMAIAGEHLNDRTWHIVQHEGFHQFAHTVIRGDLPPWVDEGLAEYFGEALFTGDSFVSGVLPPWRLARVQAALVAKKFKPLKEMMTLSAKDWIATMTAANYDQAWSMVHFLAHGEDGKYRDAFGSFIRQVGQGRGYYEAWVSVFGQDVQQFEKHWEVWWLAQTPDATLPLYEQALLLTLTSHLARAASQGQTFATFDTFLAAAEKGELKFNREDWLPPNLLQDVLKPTKAIGALVLEPGTKGQPTKLILTDRAGKNLTALFKLNGNRVGPVWVEMPAPAKSKP